MHLLASDKYPKEEKKGDIKNAAIKEGEKTNHAQWTQEQKQERSTLRQENGQRKDVAITRRFRTQKKQQKSEKNKGFFLLDYATVYFKEINYASLTNSVYVNPN